MSEHEASEVIRPKSVDVQVGGRMYSVRPFTFAQRLKVYELLAEAAAMIGGDQTALEVAKTNPAQLLPMIVKMIGPKLTGIFALILKESPEWIEENLDIRAEAGLYKAIMDVNDFPLLISQLREVGAQFGSKSKSASALPPA